MMDRRTFALSFFASAAVLGAIWVRLVDPLEATDPTAHLLGALVLSVLGFGVWILLARQRLRHAGHSPNFAYFLLVPLANIVCLAALFIMDKDSGSQGAGAGSRIGPSS